MSKIKIQNLFEFKRSFLDGLNIVYELIKGVDKYGDYSDLWYPKTQYRKIKVGEFTLEFRHSTRKYECHRVENIDNCFYEILTPRSAFEVCFGNSKFLINERADMVKTCDNWKGVTNFYNKILMQICIEDLNYGCEIAIPTLLQYAKTYNVPGYYIALKVAGKIISPYGCFANKYKDVWDTKPDISASIEKLKELIDREVAKTRRVFSLTIPASNTQPVTYSIKSTLISEKIINCDKLKEYSKSEMKKRSSDILGRNLNPSLDLQIFNFIHLADIIPQLGMYEFSESFSSEILYDEDSDEMTSTKEEITNSSRQSLHPFPIFRYAGKQRNSRHLISEEESKYKASEQEEVEALLPYYLLVNSYKVCESVSHSLQLMFVTNKYSRVYILDQIAFIIKDVKLQNLDTPKRVLLLYHHLDLFMKLWKDVLKVNSDEKDFLTTKNQYENEKGFIRDFHLILRLIETLCT